MVKMAIYTQKCEQKWLKKLIKVGFGIRMSWVEKNRRINNRGRGGLTIIRDSRVCTLHWCQNQFKEIKMFHRKLYLEETYSWWDNSITWSYATVVMCILTRKYQGAFCCSPYGVESLLNFMLSFKYEISI